MISFEFIRVTPAMQTEIADHVSDLADLLAWGLG